MFPLDVERYMATNTAPVGWPAHAGGDLSHDVLTSSG